MPSLLSILPCFQARRKRKRLRKRDASTRELDLIGDGYSNGVVAGQHPGQGSLGYYAGASGPSGFVPNYISPTDLKRLQKSRAPVNDRTPWMGNQPLPGATWPGAYDIAGIPSHGAATPYGYFTNPPLPQPNLPTWLDATYHPGAPTPHWPAQGYHPQLQAHAPPVAPNQSQQTIPGSRSQTSLHRTALSNRPDHAIRGVTSNLRNPPTQYPHLVWNIAQMPSISRRCRAPGEFGTTKFESRAVKPALSEIVIHSDQQGLQQYMELWGPIRTIRLDKAPINVEDVMNSVFDYFQMPLGPYHEGSGYYNSNYHPFSPTDWEKVLLETQKRICHSPNSYAPQHERRRGTLRIDVISAFCGTTFAGLKVDETRFDGLLLEVKF